MPTSDDPITAARPALIRALNWKTVVDILRRMGPLSRADLVRLTGMSKPTVSLALEAAEQAHLLRRAGYRTGMAGPSPLLYEVSPDAGHVLAIDIGRQYSRYAVADLTGRILAKSSYETEASTDHHGVASIVEKSAATLTEAGLALSDVRQTVIGTPGVFDAATSSLRLTGHLADWDANPAIVAGLRETFGHELLFENDVDAATIAEWEDGHGRAYDTFALVSVGTGIGMGLIINRELHRGAHGAAGEIAWLPITGGEGHDATDTAMRGPLESAASGPAVVRAAQASGLRNATTAAGVFRSAFEGDPLAKQVVETEAELVARALAAVVAVVDPQMIVLGGGIGRSAGFADAVSTRLDELVPIRPPVTTSSLGDDAVLKGAVALGLTAVWKRVMATTELPEQWVPAAADSA